MPGGKKVYGKLEEIDQYMDCAMMLIKDKWFAEKEVTLCLGHPTISRPFTLWQLNSLLGYQANEWTWDGDLLSDVYEYFTPVLKK